METGGGADRDRAFMATALGLAARGLGQVWPNPAVGCVIVQNGRVVGRGWTQPGGRPHAETEALARAGAAARGATAYVSLEPCAHHGKTPPCADALVEAGVARVVAAMEDTDPRVAGKGLERLRKAGIDVTCGVLAAEAAFLNAGFFTLQEKGRPLVTIKVATSLDGRIATHSGQSKWITGTRARARVHLMRAGHDAILIGVGTALADDPDLTCRLPGMEGRSPVRVILDSDLRLPLTCRLVRTARDIPTWAITSPRAEKSRRRAFQDCGVEVIEVSVNAAGMPDMAAALAALGGRGITRVMVEGGSHVTASLLRERLCDRLAWFRAGIVIGGDGMPVSQAFGLDDLADAPGFDRLEIVELGKDTLETFVQGA